MDINQLCPGCMRELPGAEHGKSGANAEGRQKAGKCPRCGFDAAAYRQNSRCLPLYTILAGKYLVGAVLGEGGFGITYMGYDLNMETRIAIKEYFPVELVSRDTTSMTGDRVISLSGDKSVTYKQGLKKYVTEAQNVSRFSETPGVVSVKDFFYENETAYIVMEYIEGQSLKDYLKERGGRLSEEEALDIMKPVLEALVKVHEAGIIHRDISPDNIMLTFGDGGDGGEYSGATGTKAEYKAVPGQAFGAIGNRESGIIAAADRSSTGGRAGEAGRIHTGNGAGTETMAADRGRQIDNSRHVTSVKLIDFGAARMTEKNDQKSLTIILKHGYAPEEQYRTHGEQGPWTDVYALCAVFYRMLTGQTPVPAMDRLFQDDLKTFEELSANVTKSTQAAILKGLAVKREDRIRTVTELMQALYEGKMSRRISGRNRRLVWAGAGILTVAVIGAVLAFPLLSPDVPEAHDFLAETEEPGRTPDAEIPGGEGTPENDEREDTGGQGETAENTAGNGEYMGASMEDAGEEEAPLGETIVSYNAQYSVSQKWDSEHIIFCKPDGTAEARGNNRYGQCDVYDWTYIVAVAAGTNHSVGLRADGTVLAVGSNEHGQCDVESWENIVQIAAWDNLTLGVTQAGTVNIAGGYQDDSVLENVGKWTDIRQLLCPERTNIIGIKTDGTIVMEGWGEGKEYVTLGELPDVEVVFEYGYHELVGLKPDGTYQIAVYGINTANEQENLEERMGKAIEKYKDFPRIKQLDHDGKGAGVTIDGSVVFAEGMNTKGYSNYLSDDIRAVLESWTDLESVHMKDTESCYGMKKDGTVLEYHINSGNAALEDFRNLEWANLVTNNSIPEGIVGKTRDGKILYYGSGHLGDLCRALDRDEKIAGICLLDGNAAGYLTDSGEWHRMVYGWKPMTEEEAIRIETMAAMGEDAAAAEIAVATQETWYEEQLWMPSDGVAQVVQYDDRRTAFLMKDGKVQIDPQEAERGKGRGVWEIVSGWEEIAEIIDYHNGLVGRTKSGEIVYGFETSNHDDSGKFRADCDDIAGLGKGADILFGVKEDGSVVSTPDSRSDTGRSQVNGWGDMVQVSGGEIHTVGLRSDGTVVAVGKNDRGQCDVDGWQDIIYIEAAGYCTIGITRDGDLMLAGSLY